MKRMLVAALLAAGIAAGCGEEEQETAGAASAAEPTAAVDGYTPVSSVEAHAAVGKDMARIRELIEEGDFAAAKSIWTEGEASDKDDGTKRTLAGFVEEHPVGEHVADALAGTGTAKALDDEQRAQWVDKGMVAALEVKILGEIDAALEKVKAGETDPAEGAPHNVDEAWAFYTAEGQGLSATADKRGADFGVGSELGDDVLAALRDAQTAAKAGDAGDLLQAREAVRGATNRIFALATIKYAKEGIEDEVARAEGIAFSWGLIGDLGAAERKVVERAFGPRAGFKPALAVRETLNASLPELGIAERLPAFEG